MRRRGRSGTVSLRRRLAVGIRARRVQPGGSVLQVTAHEVIAAIGALRIYLLFDLGVQYYRIGDWNRFDEREHLLVGPLFRTLNGAIDHRYRVTHLAGGYYHGCDIAHEVQPRVDLISRTRGHRSDLVGILRLCLLRFLPLPSALRRVASILFGDLPLARLAAHIFRMMMPNVPIQIVLAPEQRLAVPAGEWFLICDKRVL